MRFLPILVALLVMVPDPASASAGRSADRADVERLSDIGSPPRPAGSQSVEPATPEPQPPTPSAGSVQPASPAVTPAPAGDVPVSLGRIRRALSAPARLGVNKPEYRDGRPVYRVDVEADKIDLEAILGPDFTRGPASYGGMTHAEFLDIVTPEAVRGYAAYSNREGMMVAATSIALQWAALKAIDALKKAKDENAREAARDEVREALEALKKARRAAGLPDK